MFLRLGVIHSYVLGLVFLRLRGKSFFRLVISQSYVSELVFLRLGVGQSYVWGLVSLTFGG